MSTANPSNETASHKVGYTILRAGAGAESRAVLVTPFSGRIKNIEIADAAITLRMETCAVGLTGLPDDVRQLLASSPDRVLLVNVDTLGAVRQSASVSEFNGKYH